MGDPDGKSVLEYYILVSNLQNPWTISADPSLEQSSTISISQSSYVWLITDSMVSEINFSEFYSGVMIETLWFPISKNYWIEFAVKNSVNFL